MFTVITEKSIEAFAKELFRMFGPSQNWDSASPELKAVYYSKAMRLTNVFPSYTTSELAVLGSGTYNKFYGISPEYISSTDLDAILNKLLNRIS